MASLVKYNFGHESNDTPQIFSNLVGKRKDRLTYWQVVHFKSAASEGYLSYKILKESEIQNLQLHARSFFSIFSPLERFLPKNYLYNRPIYNRDQYLSHYQDLYDIHQKVDKSLNFGSEESFMVSRAINILRLQLYGFGRSALHLAKINHALNAFKIANLLDKPQIKKHLENYNQEYQSTQKINFLSV
jgi:hypothetical protein